MAGLTLKLEPIFEEAVDKFIASVPVDVGQDFVSQLSQTDLPESHPEAAARFLARLLESSAQPFWHMQAAQEVHRRLQAKGADVGVLGTIQGTPCQARPDVIRNVVLVTTLTSHRVCRGAWSIATRREPNRQRTAP